MAYQVTFFWPHYVPGVDSASNRNEYQEYFLGGKGGRCVGLTTLPSSCAGLSRNLGTSTSWNPQGLSKACDGIALPFFFYQVTFHNNTQKVLHLN
jgi:hypothetical protein